MGDAGTRPMEHKYLDVLKTLISLSIPTVIEQIMSTLMQYVDTAMVGHLGERATAAVSTTTTVNWLVGSVPMAISTAAVALISEANGAKDEERMKKLTGQAAFLSVTVGTAAMFLCLAISPWLPAWMGAAKEVRGPASAYFFLVSLSMVFRTASYVFGAAIRATKDTRLPMLVNLAANGMNILLNLLLIYGMRLGVAGAAIATSASCCASGTAMTLLARRKRSLRWRRADFWPDPGCLASYRKIGLPAFGTSAASCLGYVFFAGMVSGMGTTVFAAHSIAVTAEELFYIPGYGLRTATSTLIGNAVGERDARKMGMIERISIAVTLLMMLLTGALLFFSAYPLMRVFTSSPQVARLGARMLRLVAFTEPFFGLMIVLEGIFYGKGRTQGVFIVETGSMWGIRILFTFLCVKVWGLGLTAVWCCMIADNVFKSLCLLAVYLHDKRERRR